MEMAKIEKNTKKTYVFWISNNKQKVRVCKTQEELDKTIQILAKIGIKDFEIKTIETVKVLSDVDHEEVFSEE